MKFQGALITEQGVTFAIVIVKPNVLNGPQSEKDATRRSFQPYFPGVPLILMAQDSNGTPTYYGRDDIVKFLANIDMRRIPWKEYTAR